MSQVQTPVPNPVPEGQPGRFDFEDIGVLPQIVGQINVLAESPTTTGEQVARLIVQDPTLTSKILRIINSAYYGLRQEVRSIEHAVNYLGIQQVRNLVVSSTIVEAFRFDHGVVEPRCVWEHSLGCAIGAKRIGDLLPGLDGDQAYLGGLLHDIGRIYLLSRFPEQYGEVVGVSERGLMTLRTAEKSRFGCTHELVGFELGTSWGFSETVLAAIRHHHAPRRSGRLGPLVAVVSLANSMCHATGLRFGFELDDEPTPRLEAEAWKIIQGSPCLPEGLSLDEIKAAALDSLAETRNLVAGLFQ